MLDQTILLPLIPAALCVGYFGTRFAATKIRHRRAIRQHSGLHLPEFVEYFHQKGVPSQIPAQMYSYLRREIKLDSFHPHPLDEIERVYVIAGEDIDDMLNEIAGELGYDLPHSGILSEWIAPVRTVEDGVLWLNWVREQQQHSSPTAS